jgi:CRISPR/Cas system-associated exonuclease Cas4 (RecB family)
MLDFNHRPSFAEKLNERIDTALSDAQRQKPERDYMGASRLGIACARALQYEFTHAPKDEEFSARTIRIFAAGHLFEDMAIGWLRAAGLDLFTRRQNGEPFGFSVAGGRIRGHVDGVINGGPEELGLSFPMLWECKSLNAKSWKDTEKHGVAKSKPVYAAQIAIYQAYMEGTIPCISRNPALFTAINKDTAELYHELVPFNAALAQEISDRAVFILRAVESGETMPRVSADPDYFECRFCAYRNRCWEVAA